MAPERKSSSSEAKDAWLKKYDAWLKNYNAFYKKHPRPPPTEAEVAWKKKYDDFLQNNPHPPLSQEKIAWNKELDDFNSRHPYPHRPRSPPSTPLSEVNSCGQSTVRQRPSDKTLAIVDPESQSMITCVHQPEPISIADLDNQSLVPHSDRQVVVFQNQGDPLNQGDENGKHKYISGNTSEEVLLLENSTTLYLKNINEEKTNGSQLAITTNLKTHNFENVVQDSFDQVKDEPKLIESVSINHHRKKTKTSVSSHAQTIYDLDDDDDVYEIPRPLDHKGPKNRKNKAN